jgi:hypothetical protein
MGYYTDFILKASSKEALKSMEEEFNFLDQNTEDSLCYHGKWYEHESDMKTLSTKLPDVLFTVRGDGEEYGDIWIKYFKNGKVQISYVELKFDEFDETKLVGI